MLLPTPRVTRRAAGLLREHGCSSVWFGAAAPLGLMAPALRSAGARRIVATTHGHEAGWAQLPAARQLLRRIGEGTDTLTYLGEYTRSRIAARAHPGGGRADGPTAARRRREDLPPRLRRRRGTGPARAHRPAGGGVRLAARAAQGPGHPDRGDARDPGRGARRRAADRRRRPVRGGAGRAGRGDGRRRTRCASPAPSPGRNCPPTTAPATSSRCPAAPGAAAWTSRASASSTWRRPPPGCPSWRATRAARRTRCWTARPAGSSPAAPRPPTADRVITLLRDPALRRPHGRAGPRLGGGELALGPAGGAAAGTAVGLRSRRVRVPASRAPPSDSAAVASSHDGGFARRRRPRRGPDAPGA